MFLKFKNFGDPVENRVRARYFRLIVLFISPIVIAVAFTIFLKINAPYTSIVISTHILLALSLFILNRFNVTPSIQLLCGVFLYYSTFTFAALTTGGTVSVYMGWLPSTAFIAGAFLPRKQFFFFLGLVLTTIVLINGYGFLGYEFINEIPTKLVGLHNVITSIAIIPIYGLFSFFIMKSISRIEKQKTMALENTAKDTHFSSLGQMAGGVAHEINNPLMIVSGAGQRLTRIISQSRDGDINLDEMGKLTQIINSNIKRASKITKNLISLAGAGNVNEEGAYKVKDAITEITDLYALQFLEDNVIIKIEDSEPLENTNIQVSKAKLKQVLSSLLINSYSAIKELPPNKRWIEIKVFRKKDKLLIEVRDGGKIESPVIREQMFYPFYTSSPPGQNVGLGLTHSQKTCYTWGGELNFVSDNENTTFRVVIPNKLTLEEN